MAVLEDSGQVQSNQKDWLLWLWTQNLDIAVIWRVHEERFLFGLKSSGKLFSDYESESNSLPRLCLGLVGYCGEMSPLLLHKSLRYRVPL